MPNPLLFDLDALDRDAVAISAEQVAEINPHRGDMRQLDHVIWVSEDNTRALGVKQVRSDEFWVPGHIPGRPLMPGVLMIEAAAQVSSILFRLKSGERRFIGFTRCDDVVFRGQVVPGDEMLLLAVERRFGRRRFETVNQGVVNGQLAFEASITGMVF